MAHSDHHNDSSDTSDEGADLLDELRVTVARDRGQLNEVLEQTRELAEQTGLIIYPALPGQIDTYSPLAATAMDAAAFVDLAHRCGSALLYVYRDIALVDPDSDTDSFSDDDESIDSTTAALQAEATALEGRVAAVVLGFPHAGVVHTWTTAAPWASTFDTVCEYLADQTGDDDHFIPTRYTSTIEQAKVQEIAKRLAQLTEVRRKGAFSLDATDDPELAELVAEDSRATFAIREALNNIISTERETLEAELSGGLASHATELAAQRDFRAARTVAMRRRLTENYLRTLTNGLALSASLRDELEAQARASMHAGTQPML
jgi:hypothetical protein